MWCNWKTGGRLLPAITNRECLHRGRTAEQIRLDNNAFLLTEMADGGARAAAVVETNLARLTIIKEETRRLHFNLKRPLDLEVSNSKQNYDSSLQRCVHCGDQETSAPSLKTHPLLYSWRMDVISTYIGTLRRNVAGTHLGAPIG